MTKPERPFHKKAHDRHGKPDRKKFFRFGRNRREPRPESEEETLDRQRSSEQAKKIIESFEEDTRSYAHDAHTEGKVSRSLSFFLILGFAVLAVVIAVILFFFRKGS